MLSRALSDASTDLIGLFLTPTAMYNIVSIHIHVNVMYYLPEKMSLYTVTIYVSSYVSVCMLGWRLWEYLCLHQILWAASSRLLWFHLLTDDLSLSPLTVVTKFVMMLMVFLGVHNRDISTFPFSFHYDEVQWKIKHLQSLVYFGFNRSTILH